MRNIFRPIEPAVLSRFQGHPTEKRKRVVLLLWPAFIAVLLALTPRAWTQDQEDYTYRLTQSTANYEFWTTTPAQRVFKNDAVPLETGAGVLLYAAKNEFEPFQVVVRPASSGKVTVDVGDFGSGIITEIYRVRYVKINRASDHLGRSGDYPDPLWPLEKGDLVDLTGGENSAFWFSVYVPETAPPGDYTAEVRMGGINIPVTLHLFNFAVPDEVHTKSQMNFSHNTILEHYGVPCCGDKYWGYVDGIKQYFIDHRLTPKSVLWSGGVTSSGGRPYIDYDCKGNLTDNDGIWGFEEPAKRFLDGSGSMAGTFSHEFNNGAGFPSFMAVTFRDNDASADQRPDTFCEETRGAGDWYTEGSPDSPYNRKWFEYIAGLEKYLETTGYLDRAYYYFANEPQDQADYDAVAWYSRMLKNAAPNLKLMVSEDPKPEIYDHPDYETGGQIDIWLPVLNNFDPEVSFDRAQNHGEETWIYWLHGTRPPFFNPITLDHPGIESKFTGWFLWKYRVRGIAYYSLNNWSKNPWTDPSESEHNGDLFMLYPPSENNTPISYGSNHHRFVPSIRFELMRDSLEDYEYLYALNRNRMPEVNIVNGADALCDKIIKGPASYTRSSEFMYNLRRLIGLKVGGEIPAIPDILPPVAHPRSQGAPGNYHINFQDPDGEPYTTRTEETYGNGHIFKYVTLAGDDYLQAGVSQYDPAAGFGWLDDTEHFLTDRDPWGSEIDERKITYAYDDWAHHPGIFEFDLPNGTYEVEVSVGTPRKVRSHNRVVIEGVVFVDDEASEMYIVRRKEVTISDNKLTVDMGIWGEYTMLNYLDIESAEAGDKDGDGISDDTDNCPDQANPDQADKDRDGTGDSCDLSGDPDNDGDMDVDDLEIIHRHMNSPANACPSCDLDGDGTITLLDAEKLLLISTFNPLTNVLHLNYLWFQGKSYWLEMKLTPRETLELMDVQEIPARYGANGEMGPRFDGTRLQIPLLFIGTDQTSSYWLNLMIKQGMAPVTFDIDDFGTNPRPSGRISQ